jgi:RecB family exonuclease
MTDGPADEPRPKVTPWLLRRADDLCARRLAHHFAGAQRSDDPVNRSRLREAFLDAARTAHSRDEPLRAAAWTVPSYLEPEEQAVLHQAFHWYVQIFDEHPARLDPHDCDLPTESLRHDIRVGGWVDLTLRDGAGRPELRQVGLWGERVPENPLDAVAVQVAVLRLAGWAGSEPLRVSWSDLVGGGHTAALVDPAEDLPALVAGFRARLATVRTRSATPVAQPGRDCGGCPFVRGCPAHTGGFHVRQPRGDLRPGVLGLSPSALETWTRCPREWRNRYVLGLPASDHVPTGAHGLRLHAVLRLLHETGDCRDEARRQDAVVAHDGDERLRTELERHAWRCPSPSPAYGHECDVARFHGRPAPQFMATARLDAAWIHDGMLDVRDYKTGRVWYERVADDPRARLQAWVAAPLAAERRLRLRIRYEHLSAEVLDDPDAWEPDPDELEAIEADLLHIVNAMRSDAMSQGVHDETVCTTCRYRSICPDTAAPTAPSWPRIELDPAIGPAVEDDAP